MYGQGTHTFTPDQPQDRVEDALPQSAKVVEWYRLNLQSQVYVAVSVLTLLYIA